MKIILQEKKNKFLTLSSERQINLYLCGPTVYSDVHIGNCRGTIVFDLLIRLLKEQKYDYVYYQNITDIDDKIIAAAQKQQISEDKLTNFYFQEYLSLLKKMNVVLPQFKKVTDHMDHIIYIIKCLYGDGFLYQTANGIYFDTQKIDYLKLLGSNYSSFFANKTMHKDKKHHFDFVLWKFNKKGKTFFSPWGDGRPGWHTECVALIYRLFKTNLTIHGGGNDLTFPHHFNEQIQFKAAFPEHNLTQMWLRNGFVNFKNEKISKSNQTKNIFIAKNFLKHYSPNVLRFLFYFAFYKRDINLTEELLNYYVDLEKKIINTLTNVRFNLFLKEEKDLSELSAFDQSFWNRFLSFLNDDLNTVKAMDLMLQLLKKINFYSASKSFLYVFVLAKTFLKCLDLMGIKFTWSTFTPEVKTQINKWIKLRDQKDYHAADVVLKWLQMKKIHV